jgi:membrane fusion protein (multidrug efflux system)
MKFAQEERTRYDELMKSGSGTVQRAQQTDAALRAQTAQLQQGKAGLIAANKKIEVLSTEQAKAVAQLDHARAVEQQAALNLSYTRISAPVEGTVGARSLRVGQFVQAGTQLMAVVPLDAVYVVANFKETQLTHVRNGQPVELRVDSFHGTKLKGHVDSLSPASGLEFALLPPDNATGNFTKIVQRVPVKIVLDDQSLNGLLRPGMSAVPTVNTKAAVLAERKTQRQIAANRGRPNGG